MAELIPKWDQARTARTKAYYDELINELKPIVDNFNNSMDDPIMWLWQPPSLLLQRRNSYIKVILEGPGSIRIAFGYRDASGSVVYPQYNRLLLDTQQRWVLYRYSNNQQIRVEGLDLKPTRLAKILATRMSEVSSMAPDLITTLSL